MHLPPSSGRGQQCRSPRSTRPWCGSRSDQKPPERVVYDTSLPHDCSSGGQDQIAAVPPALSPTPPHRRGCATPFAQFVPAEARKVEKQIEPQAPRKRKIAKSPPGPAVAFCPATAFWLLREQHLVGLPGSRPSAAASGFCRQSRCSSSSRSSSSFRNRHSLTPLAAAGLAFGSGLKIVS